MEPSKTTGNGHPASPLGAASETLGQIGAGLQALASKESIEGLREKIDLPKRMKSNPYGTLAIALGAGYVLGGGLFSSLTRRVLGAGLKVGLRLGAIALVEQQVAQLISRASNSDRNSNPNPNEGDPS
jgi:hypothetical protein